MKILDGKKIALELQGELELQVATIKGRKPGLALVLVGQHPASLSYIKGKKKGCSDTGISSFVCEFPSSISEGALLGEIDRLNKDPSIDGILVQLPLPSHISDRILNNRIDPDKDVDGFHPLNVGKMLLGEEGGFLPCTPNGIKILLERSSIPVAGKHIVIVGRSNIVGKPLAAILMQKKQGCNATVTIAHSQSERLKELILSADILIAAMGAPLFIKKEMIHPGSTVIDVGIHRMPNGKLVGDVDFADVSQVAGAITPVPGGGGTDDDCHAPTKYSK